MVTYFLGEEETRAYLREFFERFRRFEEPPALFCPITESGNELLRAMVALVAQEFPELAERVQFLPIAVDESYNVTFVGAPEESIPGRHVLLLDGAVHSGRMMSACAEAVLNYNPVGLSSYTLVLKRGSTFIPTFWSLMIHETDRAYFLLKAIPNHRLDVGSNKQPPVHLSRLCKKTVSLPKVTTGVSSMDRVEWSERLFQMQATEYQTCTYLLRHGSLVVGYLTLHKSGDDTLVIDELAADQKQQGKGYGGILLRFADTFARQGDCIFVRLNAIEDKVPMYQRFSYQLISDKEPLELGPERYFPMQKRLLHHQGLLS